MTIALSVPVSADRVAVRSHRLRRQGFCCDVVLTVPVTPLDRAHLRASASGMWTARNRSRVPLLGSHTVVLVRGDDVRTTVGALAAGFLSVPGRRATCSQDFTADGLVAVGGEPAVLEAGTAYALQLRFGVTNAWPADANARIERAWLEHVLVPLS